MPFLASKNSPHDRSRRPLGDGAARRIAAGAAALVLLLGACSAGDNAELTIVDDELPGSSEQTDATPDTADDEAVELDVGGSDADDSDRDLPVPDAAIPPAPAPESSPAERQRLQELGLTPEDLTVVERLPTPEEDLDDASTPGNGPVVIDSTGPVRDDLDQFPSSIPVTVPGASGDEDDGEVFTGDPINGPFPEFDPAFDGTDPSQPAADEGLGADPVTGQQTLNGAVIPDPDQVAVPDERPVLEPIPEIDICDAAAQCVDGVPFDPATAPPIDDTEATGSPAEPEPVDCELHPWERGCDGPAPYEDGQDFWNDDLGPNGEIDESEGVDVPQDVIDLLLTPGDNEG